MILARSEEESLFIKLLNRLFLRAVKYEVSIWVDFKDGLKSPIGRQENGCRITRVRNVQ